MPIENTDRIYEETLRTELKRQSNYIKSVIKELSSETFSVIEVRKLVDEIQRCNARMQKKLI